MDDDLERRLRAHYRALDAPLPDDIVTAARARIARDGRSRSPALLIAASLGAVALLVVGIAATGLGLPDREPMPTDAASPPSSASPSASSDSPVYEAGQTLRATAPIRLQLDWSIRPGQSFYVAGVVDDQGSPAYRLQHWGDLVAGIKPDTVVAVVPASEVDPNAEPYDPTCPAVVDDILDVAALQPFERLVCFGDRELAFGPVRRTELAVMGGNPPWLGGPSGADFFTGLPFRVRGGVTVAARTWLRATGHFDDAACAAEDLVCRERFTVTGTSVAAAPSTELAGTWRPMEPGPLAGRSGAASVWTGSELVIWGGNIAPDPSSGKIAPDRPDGAAYDPFLDTWRSIATGPLGYRDAPQALWTGSEMLVWGGSSGASPLRDGAAYDPAADTWRTLADAPFAVNRLVWTDGRAVAVGDGGEAAAYDPSTDTWAPLPGYPVTGGWPRSVVSTGSEVLVFVAPDGVDTAIEGYRLRLGDAAWHPMAPSPQWALYAGQMIWTGDEAIGIAIDRRSDLGRSGSAAYDPLTDTWRELAGCHADSRDAVWTGSLLLGFYGAYDPATDECLTLPEAPPRTVGATTGRESFAYAWTGTEYLAWSGGDGSDRIYRDDDGVAFTPSR